MRIWRQFILAGVSVLLLIIFEGRADASNEWLRNVTCSEPFFRTEVNTQTVYCTRTQIAPVIDGKLNEPCWQAVPPFKLGEPDGNPPPKASTFVRLLYTHGALYVGARCEPADVGYIKRDLPADARDKGAYLDDCLELFLQTSQGLRHLVLGAGGARDDFGNSLAGYDPEWQAATVVTGDVWEAEMKIPDYILGIPLAQPGVALRFNIGRDEKRRDAPYRARSSLFTGYRNPREMGLLVFGTAAEREQHVARSANGSVNGIRFVMDKWVYDDLNESAYGRVRLLNAVPPAQSGTGASTSLSFKIVVRLKLQTSNEIVQSATVTPVEGAVTDFQFDTRSIVPGRYTVAVEVQSGAGTNLAEASYPLIRKTRTGPSLEDAITLNVDIPSEAAEYISREVPSPVYAGVPMPRGAASKETVFRLFDEQGTELPCQAEILATWSPGGSTKWVGIYFQVMSAETRKLVLKYGGKGQSQPPKSPLKLERTSSGYRINTGCAQFEILKSRYDGIHQAWLDLDANGAMEPNEQMLAEGGDNSPYVIDQHGTVYFAGLDSEPNVEIEIEGPLCTVLRASGWYVAKDGGRVCRHVTRFFAYAGLSWLRIQHTFVFCADSRDVKLADVGVPLALKGALPMGRFGARPRDLHLRATGSNTCAYLIQLEKNHYDFQYSANGHNTIYARGTRAEGWLEAGNEQAAVAIGLRDFWQNYPKELEAWDGRIVMHIWPRHGEDMPVPPLTVDNVSELWFMHHRRYLDFQVPAWFDPPDGQQPGPPNYLPWVLKEPHTANGMGVARSSELFVNFRRVDKDSTPAVAACVNYPPVACAGPEWMCSSGVFGPLSAADEEEFPVIEKALDARFDGERLLEHFSYGMWNYGGSVTYYEPFKNTYRQADRPWRLNHHGTPRIPWLLFARTGQRKYFEYGCRNSLRCVDIGYCHYSTPAMEKAGYHGKIRGALCDYKGVVPWHSGSRALDYNCMADYQQYFGYLADNRWALEVMREWGACVKRYYQPLPAGREHAGVLDSLLSLYEATWDMDYREMAERQFDHVVDNAFTPEGYFAGGWLDYAPWVSHFYRATGSEKVRDVAVRWCNRLLRDHWLGKISNWNGVDIPFCAPYGYPDYDIMAVAYGENGDTTILNLALGCANVIGLSVLPDPRSRLYGYDMYSGHSLGGYFQQTVLYILPLLKKHKDQVRALFPRWELMGRKIRLLIKDAGNAPLELRICPGDMRHCSRQAPMLAMTLPGGKAVAPQPLEIVREVRCREPLEYTQEYFAIRLEPDMLRGITELVLTPRDDKELSIFLPLQTSRPAKIIFSWEPSLCFGPGSAIYFSPRSASRRVRVTADPVASYPAAVAILDEHGKFVTLEQWFPIERPRVILEAPAPMEHKDAVWCCLQGHGNRLYLRLPSGEMAPWFADQPERYFYSNK